MVDRRPQADGVSRFLGVLAILLTGASSVYLYQQNQNLKSDLASVTNGEESSVYEKHATEWDAKLTEALNQFSVDTKESLDKFDEARIARDDVMTGAIRMSVDDVQKIVQDELLSSERVNVAKPVVNPPELRIAESALKLVEGDEQPDVLIANEGDIRASIESVKFQPTPDTQFRSPLPPEPKADQIVIRFLPEDNKPTKAGHHKLYEKSLLVPEYVGANQTVPISIEISNDLHVDWGMEGELRIAYDNGETLVIPSIRAIFVPEQVDI